MNIVQRRVLDMRNDLFGIFDEVYLFGSCLSTETPVDVDILLVYNERKRVSQILAEKRKIANVLSFEFGGLNVDFTMLSKGELDETRFLDSIAHKRIKGR